MIYVSYNCNSSYTFTLKYNSEEIFIYRTRFYFVDRTSVSLNNNIILIWFAAASSETIKTLVPQGQSPFWVRIVWYHISLYKYHTVRTQNGHSSFGLDGQGYWKHGCVWKEWIFNESVKRNSYRLVSLTAAVLFDPRKDLFSDQTKLLLFSNPVNNCILHNLPIRLLNY